MGGVAETTTWEQLRELAAFRAKQGWAVSLYVGLDPSIVPTAGSLASHTRSLLASAERQLNEQSATLSPDERKSLARDLERIDGWFGGVCGLEAFGERTAAVR